MMRPRFTIRLMRLIVTFCEGVAGAEGAASVEGGIAGEVASDPTAGAFAARVVSGMGTGRMLGVEVLRLGELIRTGAVADVVSKAGAGAGSAVVSGAAADVASGAGATVDVALEAGAGAALDVVSEARVGAARDVVSEASARAAGFVAPEAGVDVAAGAEAMVGTASSAHADRATKE